ncbi:unnamed protein product, partial [Mesorhabditis belari]|uniref:Lipocalin/cytosolic fatty-acid binding domain-containing protein n=1 Tax=Mesorhabditis belari TaxID=2138241 RepID=A0AAF3FJF8_9BILA
MTLEAFTGKWIQSRAENFEEYLKEVGVGLMMRKAAANIKVTLTITVEGNKITMKQESTFKNQEHIFVIGEEKEEETADGRKFRSTITLVDGKLVQKQTPIKAGDKASTITRWVQGNELHVQMESGNVKALRVYTKQ